MYGSGWGEILGRKRLKMLSGMGCLPRKCLNQSSAVLVNAFVSWPLPIESSWLMTRPMWVVPYV